MELLGSPDEEAGEEEDALARFLVLLLSKGVDRVTIESEVMEVMPEDIGPSFVAWLYESLEQNPERYYSEEDDTAADASAAAVAEEHADAGGDELLEFEAEDDGDEDAEAAAADAAAAEDEAEAAAAPPAAEAQRQQPEAGPRDEGGRGKRKRSAIVFEALDKPLKPSDTAPRVASKVEVAPPKQDKPEPRKVRSKATVPGCAAAAAASAAASSAKEASGGRRDARAGPKPEEKAERPRQRLKIGAMGGIMRSLTQQLTGIQREQGGSEISREEKRRLVEEKIVAARAKRAKEQTETAEPDLRMRLASRRSSSLDGQRGGGEADGKGKGAAGGARAGAAAPPVQGGVRKPQVRSQVVKPRMQAVAAAVAAAAAAADDKQKAHEPGGAAAAAAAAARDAPLAAPEAANKTTSVFDRLSGMKGRALPVRGPSQPSPGQQQQHQKTGPSPPGATRPSIFSRLGGVGLPAPARSAAAAPLGGAPLGGASNGGTGGDEQQPLKSPRAESSLQGRLTPASAAPPAASRPAAAPAAAPSAAKPASAASKPASVASAAQKAAGAAPGAAPKAAPTRRAAGTKAASAKKAPASAEEEEELKQLRAKMAAMQAEVQRLKGSGGSGGGAGGAAASGGALEGSRAAAGLGGAAAAATAARPLGFTPEELAAKREVDARSIAVTNVDPRANSAVVMAHFKTCGDVKRVTVKPQRRMAFVEFETRGAAARAVELTGSTLLSMKVFVAPKSSFALPSTTTGMAAAAAPPPAAAGGPPALPPGFGGKSWRRQPAAAQ